MGETVVQIYPGLQVVTTVLRGVMVLRDFFFCDYERLPGELDLGYRKSLFIYLFLFTAVVGLRIKPLYLWCTEYVV